MFRGILLSFALFLSSDAWAAARTSSQNGNWNDTATWGGSAAPGIGDTASIGHQVTITANTTVGTSPAEGNMVVTVTTAGDVFVNSGIVFTVRGGVSLAGNATWNQAAGSSFIFDASNASSPTSQQYELRIGTGHNEAAKLISTGTVGSRVVFDSQSGGGNGWINDGDGPWLSGAGIEAEYTDFKDIGDASNRAIRTSPSQSGDLFKCLFCRFIDSGGIGGTYNMNAQSNYRIEDSHFTGTLQTEAVKLENASGYTSGTRTFYRSSFDQPVQFYTPVGFDIQGNFFNESFESTDGQWVTFSNNFVRFGFGNTPALVRGSTTGRNYGFHGDSTNSNPHYWQVGNYNGQVVEGLTCESAYITNGNSEGDCVQLSSPGGAVTVDVTKTLVIPDAFGGTSGTIFSALGNANITARVYRNTHVANTTDEACVALGETYAGHTGMVTRLDSNLCVNLTAGTDGPIAWDSGGNDSVTDLVSAANGNRNCHYQLDSVRYVNLELSTGTLGANDVNANPSFVDSSRDLASWAGSIGLTASNAAAISCLSAMNSSTATAGCTPTAVNSWVAAGFVPTSASLDGAGLSGVDCGAFDVVLSTGLRGASLLMGVGK